MEGFRFKLPLGTQLGFFFNYYLAGPQTTLGHFQRNSLTNPMVIIAFSTISTSSIPGALKQVKLITRPLVTFGSDRYNTVINIGLVMIISSTVAQSWLMGILKAVKKFMRPTFLLKVLGWQREKEEMLKIQKFECLENKKKLLDEIKSVFISFLRDNIC